MQMIRNILFVFLVNVVFAAFVSAQTPQKIQYPNPVKFFELTIENQKAQMAYMDVAPTKPNGETVILFHGKNFNGYYWKDVIPMLTDAGFRVIVPDQIGWGKSAKPNIHYSFHLLAANNKKLLDSLNIKKVHVLAHSMGGMLAVRFALMFPETVTKLILENPIGLEDYKTFVPYQSIEDLTKQELAATYESYKTYQKTYYPTWKSEYEQYVAAQAEALSQTDFPNTAFVNALTSQMIYEQPVVYEFKDLKVPTLLIIGQEDRTVVGKNRLPKNEQNKYGNYPELGKKTSHEIKNSRLVELAGVRHIPHIQEPEKFKSALLDFLKTE